jgi:hypothetical protein
MMRRVQTSSARVCPKAICASYWPIKRAPWDLYPLPALGGDLLGLGRKLLGRQAIEQGNVLEPAASVILEQVAQHRAARCLISTESDEPRPTIRGAHGTLGELAADEVGLLVVGPLQCLPHLLLPGLVGGDRESHELLQGHAVLGIDPEQLLGDGGQAQPLLHDGRGYEEAGGDLLVAGTLVA